MAKSSQQKWNNCSGPICYNPRSRRRTVNSLIMDSTTHSEVFWM